MSDQMSMYHTALRKKEKRNGTKNCTIDTGMAVISAWVLYNNFLNDKPTSMREFKEQQI